METKADVYSATKTENFVIGNLELNDQNNNTIKVTGQLKQQTEDVVGEKTD